MLANTAQWIEDQSLFRPDDRLLLAVSGGMDSVVMLDVLHRLGYTKHAGIAHCNFQLRGGESDEDAAFVGRLADDYGLACHAAAFDTKTVAKTRNISIQMAARDLRYAYFDEIRQQFDYTYVLTAHHLDDRLETFWINFTRGAGLKGLAALQARNGFIRRPLLHAPRQAIAAYQQAQQLPHREDSSNATDAYSRNHFRHHVLPALYTWTPQLGEKAAANFQHIEEMLFLYHESIERYRQQWLQPKGDYLCIDRRAVIGHPSAPTLLWEWLHPMGFDAEQCRQARVAQAGTLLYSPTHVLLVKTDSIDISPIGTDSPSRHLWPSDLPAMALDSGTLTQAMCRVPATFPQDKHTIYVNAEALVYPLQVRHWKAGDVFCPLGMNGQQQKLQDFFTNQKIDRLERQRQWLLLNGNGDIVWVIGHRLDDRYKLSAGESTAIRFTFAS